MLTTESPSLPLLTVRDVALRLKVTEDTVRLWLRTGDLEGRRLGRNGTWRVSEEALARYSRKETAA
jgi:excisionase family DNA binding protein